MKRVGDEEEKTQDGHHPAEIIEQSRQLSKKILRQTQLYKTPLFLYCVGCMFKRLAYTTIKKLDKKKSGVLKEFRYHAKHFDKAITGIDNLASARGENFLGIEIEDNPKTQNVIKLEKIGETTKKEEK